MMKLSALNSSSTSKRNKIIAVVVALVVAGLGYVFIAVRASGFFASVNPQDATLSGNAQLVTDTNGQKAIKFSTASTTPPPTTPPPTTPPTTGDRICPAFPAMPNEACTGVPSGVTLSSAVSSITTTSDGQVIDGKYVTGEIIINHNNVTIKNSRILGAIQYQVRGGSSNAKGLVIKDSDIGPEKCPSGTNEGNRLIKGSDYTLLRSRVHNNGDDLVSLFGTAKGSDTILIQDNIFDRTCFYAGDHLDIIQMYDPGAVAKVNIIHNKMDARPVNSGDKGNASIIWADNPGSGSRLTFYNNQFAGGNYTLFLLDAKAGSGVIIDGHDNLFEKGTYTYGPCTSSPSVPFNGSAGLKFTNNKFTDGTPVSC